MQRFKVKLVLRDYDLPKTLTAEEKAKTDIPISLRIYVDGKYSFKGMGHAVQEKFWDSKQQMVKASHRYAKHINSDLLSRKTEAQKALLDAQLGAKTVSAKTIKKKITQVDEPEEIDKDTSPNFFEFVETWKKEVAGKREGSTLENYTKHLKKIRQYTTEPEKFTLNKVTTQFIIDYETHLRTTVGNNYTHKLITTLRTFILAAKKKKILKENPFESYEFPQYKKPLKDHLDAAELKKWEKHIPDFENTAWYETAVWFFFACYSSLRISDWYQFNEDYVEESIMRLPATVKTDTPVIIPITPPLRRALERILRTPLTDQEPEINRKLKTIAKKLKINKYLTTHTGRHTFAVTVCLAKKISSETAAKMMSITLDTFVNNYSQVNDEKIRRETLEGWKHFV